MKTHYKVKKFVTESHQIGEIIQSRYRIDSILGEGGISITYAATDLQTGDRVALKALTFRRMNDWKVLELFEREAKVLAQLNHPAIARYLDYFQIDTDQDRDFYIVQQLVEGQSLMQVIADGWHGSEADIKQIAEQVLDVLIYLHELKPPIIHRDIKPQNIILQPNGNIAIVDFGAVQDTYRNTQVSGSTFVGTYGYMPPEQYRGRAVPSTDLYALGATIIFLLTGRSPADLPEIRFKIDFRNAVSISPQFANWLDKMIEPAIEDRFSSARQSLNFLQNGTSPSFEGRIRDIKSDRLIAKRLRGKPPGSRIKIKKTDSWLEIYIPPAGWSSGQGICLLFFAIVWNGFLGLTFTLPVSGIFILFSIPFWATGILMTYIGLSFVFDEMRLFIDDRAFRIEWKFLVRKRQVNGKTQDLQPIKPPNNEPVSGLWLYQGLYSHQIGKDLTRVERDWLLQEINDFLEIWESRH